MEKRNIGEVITMFLVEGYLDEDDIIPVLKKGTAKMMGEKEEKIFTQPLQKESEWESELKELLEKQGVDIMEDGGHQIFDEQVSLIIRILSNREKEIAEEVKKLYSLYYMKGSPASYINRALDKVLQILKH